MTYAVPVRSENEKEIYGITFACRGYEKVIIMILMFTYT